MDPDEPERMEWRHMRQRMTKREREAAVLMHAERTLDNLLKRFSRPRQRYENVSKAILEIRTERLALEIEMDGTVTPGPRRFATKPGDGIA